MNKIVYSTDPDWQQKCEKCGESIQHCKCENNTEISLSSQIAHIRCEKKGRAGKKVTTISKLKGDLKQLQKEIQTKCASGGSVKNGVIEIQGDQRNRIATILQEKGYKVKIVGG